MKKILHFEGLRGLAALIVFIAHFIPTFCLNIDKDLIASVGITDITTIKIISNFLKLFYDGELPVYIFWFMSAYLISIKLFDPERNKNGEYLIEASTKRYFRLAIPVFASSIVCFILLKAGLIQNIQLAKYHGHEYQSGWLNNYYHFDPGFFAFLKTTLVDVFLSANSSYNMVLWTMSPELLGSLLCFGSFAVFGQSKNRFIIYLAMTIFLFIAGIFSLTNYYYVVFLCGIIWCDVLNSMDENVFLKNNIKQLLVSKAFPVAILIFVYCTITYSDVIKPIHPSLYYFFDYPLKAIGITMLINNFGFLKKILSFKPFTFLGKISFSLYLIHIPLLFSIGAYLFMYAGFEPEYKIPLLFSILLVLTIAISYLFTILVDDKSIAISNRIGKFFSNK